MSNPFEIMMKSSAKQKKKPKLKCHICMKPYERMNHLESHYMTDHPNQEVKPILVESKHQNKRHVFTEPKPAKVSKSSVSKKTTKGRVLPNSTLSLRD